LPTRAPGFGADRYLDLMGYDKKVHKGKLRLVLLKSIGEAHLTSEFSARQLRNILDGVASND
jgi:3-dehydroquinate synthase